MKVRTKARYTYPDTIVVCEKPLFDDLEKDVLTNPTIVIEILSPLTETYDRGGKFAAYRQIKSLQSYVLVSQFEARIEIYNRQGDGWHFSEVIGLDKTLRLESVNCTLNLTEVYEKVDFSQAEQTT